jgi:hypothetical protein
MRYIFTVIVIVLAVTGFSATVLDYESIALFSDVIIDPVHYETKALVFYFDRSVIENHPQLFDVKLREDALGVMLIQPVADSSSDTIPEKVTFDYDYTPAEGYERVSGYLMKTFLRYYAQGEEIGGKSDCGDCGSPLAQGSKSFDLKGSRGIMGGLGLWIQFFSPDIDPYRDYAFSLDWFIMGQRIQQEVFFIPGNTQEQFCHWDSSLLLQIPQAFMPVLCTAIETPLVLVVKPIEGEAQHFSVSIDGVALLSDASENPGEVTAFNEKYLLGKKLFLSYPEYLEREELEEYVAGQSPVPVLVWKAGTESEIPEILWNLTLITNGFAAVDGNNLVLSPLLKICGCQ